MRYAWASFAILVSGIAHAENAWTEYGVGVPLRPLQGLTEVACEIDVTLHGAIASVEQRVRISNPGNEALGATTDFELPDGAQLVGLEVKHGASKADAALAVTGALASERVSAPDVIGADPAM